MTSSASQSDSHPNIRESIEHAKRLIENSQDADAVRILKFVLDRVPDCSEARLLIAQALTGCGRGDEVERHLTQALDDPETASMASGMLGYWFQARGRFSEAKDQFERSIAIDPRQSLAYYGWAQANKLAPDDRKMLDQVASLLNEPTIPPDDAMYLRYVLGKGLADLGDFEGSMAHYDRANEAAFEQLLGGRPFHRAQYAEMIASTIGTFSREFFARNRGIGSNSRKPIFVVGMMRSGTTLVEQILSSHPEVGGAGEIEYWLDVGPSLFDSTKRSVGMKKLVASSAHYLALLKSICPGVPRVTDKMPQNFQMLGLIHLAFPKAPIIHIRRNPVDTCLSIYTTAYQKSPAFAHDRESIVFAYRQYLHLVAHWRKVLPNERFFEIDYEALVVDPEPAIRRMVEFCGLSWDERCMQPESNDRVITTPSLWQARQPVYRTAVERWRVYEPWLGIFRQLLDL